MVVDRAADIEEPVPRDALLVYLADMGGQCAALSVAAGAPEAATAFLRAVLALQRAQANAAPGDAA